ncbi:hypothetical protein A8A54_04375 [Brucella pseudogrignonensis]|uniref:hypothetical protein n=1 Tax=Brucella pseudogrignonensis TaxID=419475 RepID=UPI0007DA8347|nr:hypothetical protein [Brucella pseudogrignonensis]ANG95787.1 hypothetical protein A8A54_04375 [Brucella pseudogrignonensis]
MTIATDLSNIENTEEMALAHSTRRYLFRRSKGLKMAEYSSGGQEIERSYALANALPFRKIRQDGQPWDVYLGPDTTVKDDIFLQGFFALCAPDPSDPEASYCWQRLLKECQSNRLKALRKWRNLGAEAISRAAMQRTSPMADTEVAKTKLKPIYLRKAVGKKPLKAPAKPSQPRGKVREA